MDEIPYKKRVVIQCFETHVTFELLRLTDADDETWTKCLCLVNGPGVSARVPLELYGDEGLPQFFDEMTTWWKRLDRRKATWCALEGQLAIEAKSDTGHVVLECETLTNHVDGWRLRFDMYVESGEQIKHLADDLRDFFEQ